LKGVAKKQASVPYGNCKCPQFQYSNYATSIVDNAKSIHAILVKEFMAWQIEGGAKKSVAVQHEHLYGKLK
jgi:hypothetical protein